MNTKTYCLIVNRSSSNQAANQTFNSFTANVTRNITNNLASSVIDSAINGRPLTEQTLANALTSAFISAGAAQGAFLIGEAATPLAGSPAQINAYTQALAHAMLGCAAGAASATGGCSAGAMGAVVGELSAAYALQTGASSASALAFAKTMSAASGVMAGDTNNVAAVNVTSMTGGNAAQYNTLYHYKGKIIARDSKDNDKIINLSDNDLRKLAAETPEILDQLIAGIGKTDAPILVKDSSAQSMTKSSIQDLNNSKDRQAIAKESDMDYVNIDGQARVFVQTDSTGKVLSNASKISDGVNGDAFGTGRTRVDLDLLCGPGNQRCTFETKSDGTIDTSKPVKFTGGKNDDGTPKNQTLDEFLATADGKKC